MDFKDVKNLIEMIDKSSIDELEIINKGDVVRLKIKKNKPETIYTQTQELRSDIEISKQIQVDNVPVSTEATKEADSSVETEVNIYKVKSPIVGTFYRAPSPDSDPFVELGSFVKKDATLCIIEAMKIMNEIDAEVSGKITKILVENAQSVEYGDVLFHVELS